jgi:hypothetical protein
MVCHVTALSGQLRGQQECRHRLASLGLVAHVGHREELLEAPENMAWMRHVTRFLAERYADVVGLDLSSAMIEIARKKPPDLVFETGSMLELPVPDAGWAGIPRLASPAGVLNCSNVGRGGGI